MASFNSRDIYGRLMGAGDTPQAGGFINRLSPYYGGGSTLGSGAGGNAPGGGSDIPGRPGGSTVSYNDFVAQGPTPGDAATGTMKGLGTGPQNIFGWDPTNPMARYGMYTDPRTGRRARGAADIMASMMSRGWRSPNAPDVNFTFADADRLKSEALSSLAADYAAGKLDFETKVGYETYMAQQAYDAANPGGGIGQIGARPQNPFNTFFDQYGSTGPFENPDWAQPDPKLGYSEYLGENGWMKPGYRDDPFWQAWADATGGRERPPLMAGGLGGQSQQQIDDAALAYRNYMRKYGGFGVSPDPYDDNGNPWPDTTEADIAYYKAWCQANGKNPADPQSQADFQAAQQQG